MEKFSGTQENPDLNFLDRNLIIDLEHDKDTIEQFPDITEEDLETKRERYRVLLGRIGKTEGGHIRIYLDAVLELEDGDLPVDLAIKEGNKEIRNINLGAIRKLFESMKAEHPELKELDMIGDMHTHPVMLREYMNDLKPWEPSQNDVDDIIANYENGTLSKSKPFIFSVAGPDENRKTQYAFYRLIFEDGKYKVESL